MATSTIKKITVEGSGFSWKVAIDAPQGLSPTELKIIARTIKVTYRKHLRTIKVGQLERSKVPAQPALQVQETAKSELTTLDRLAQAKASIANGEAATVVG